jgi:uncharacterized protein YbdZ (MbtH family)
MVVMTNPFDDENGTFTVLTNKQGRHCLWPTFAEIPAGWESVTAPADRAESLAYIEANWTDMHTRSLGLRARPSENGHGHRD